MIRTKMSEAKGGALIITIALLFMLSMVGVMAINRSETETDLSFNQVRHDQAFWLAEAGIERAVAILGDSTSWRAGFNQEPLGNGYFTVVVTDSSTDTTLGETVRVISLGQRGVAASGIEVIMGPESYHPLYDHAIYAGNYMEYDSSVDSQSYSLSMDFGGNGSSGDIINGDVFHNGNISITGDALIDGSAEGGGSVTGNPPTGTATSNAEYLEPPDLQAMNYGSTADFVVNGASPWDASGRISSADPRHIFVKEYRADLAASVGFDFDNTNYFFGDPWASADIHNVSVSASGNHKTYFIDGNLWIEPGGTTSQLINSPPQGTQITVVVKGNIYFADDLLYDNDEFDALAFVAMSDGESYTDQNGNNQFDVGEPLLRDDGDGIYEGNIEGSGNIFFGDPNGGPLGHVHAYLYADNNFADHVLDPSGNPLDFEITGTMSAGNEVDINRDFAGGHAQMRVNYDDRLAKGLVNLPGLPTRSGSTKKFIVLSWREL